MKDGDCMEYSFSKDVKLFMVFDILGDTERTGPHLWQIDRFRLEDVKNHVLDLLLIVRLLKKYFPDGLDYDKIEDYIICHDLPEAITGDITKFEGVPDDEIKRVTNLAIEWLGKVFDDVMPLSGILNNYEAKVDIESKIVNMIDRVHSSTTFIKYQSEQDINMDEEGIKYAYIGQAKHILTRLAQHLTGYQHIDLSIRKHGLYSNRNFYNRLIRNLTNRRWQIVKSYSISFTHYNSTFYTVF